MGMMFNRQQARPPLSAPFLLTSIRLLVAFIVTVVSVPRSLMAQTIITRCGTGLEAANAVGDATATNIGNPFGVEVDRDGHLYICEVSNHRILRQDRDTGRLTIVAGTGEPGYAGDGTAATSAMLNEPYELRFDEAGNLFVVEMRNHVVRRIDRATGIITTVAGTGTAGYSGDGGPATTAMLDQPHSIALGPDGSVFIADIGNHRIRRVDPRTGRIESIAGTGEPRLPTSGMQAAGQPVLGPRALYRTGTTLWVALREGHSVWSLDLASGRWQHWAGMGEKGYSGDGGAAIAATLNGPKGIVVDAAEQQMYVVDTENQVIRQLDIRARTIETLAGSGPQARGFAGDGGPARKAQLNRPHGICLDAKGNVMIGDSENHRVRQVSVTR
jgi:sugar lactone lactonase YvrE